MIVVYSANETDFTHNGLGPVDPITCEVSETLNGLWELELSHARDDLGKCGRLRLGNIIKAPVPAGYTPAIDNVTGGRKIYKVTLSDPASRLLLRKTASTSSAILGKYGQGTEVEVLDADDPQRDTDWYECAAPDGKHGYMHSAYLVYQRTEGGERKPPAAMLREQPFRIYKLEQGITTVTAYARHIFYDLMDNALDGYSADGVTGAAAAAAILSHCRGEHGFRIYSDLTATANVDFGDMNPVEALLGRSGLTEKYSAEIARDWWDIYATERVGRDTDIVIRQGKNLTDLTGTLDATNMVTRLIPIGAKKDGDKLYLPEVYVENENNAESPSPVRWGTLTVSDAKVGRNGMTTSQAYDAMRQAAQAEFDKGCDQPDYTIDVDFVNLGDTLEYADYGIMYDLGIGDSVRVISENAGVDTRMRLTEYVYDCLSGRYTSAKLGSIEDYTTAVAKAVGGSPAARALGVTPAAYQAASTASSVSDLRSDFNALLAALQNAGLMRTE